MFYVLYISSDFNNQTITNLIKLEEVISNMKFFSINTLMNLQ
jgi:hypothetical protein